MVAQGDCIAVALGEITSQMAIADRASAVAAGSHLSLVIPVMAATETMVAAAAS